MLSEETIERFRKEVSDFEIHNKLDETLDRDTNYNYEIVSTFLQNAKSNHISKRAKKFSKRRHKRERWMTDELWRKLLKNNMYVDGKTTPNTHRDYENVKLNFKGYEKIVSKGIEKAKKKKIMIAFL